MRKRVLASIIIAMLIIPALNLNKATNTTVKISSQISSMKYQSKLNNVLSGMRFNAEGKEAVREFDFANLLQYVRAIKGNFSEFPLRNTEDGYINATYYGILSMYFLGVIEEITGNNKLAVFLKYLYDEQTGGFRDWLGGNVSIQSTTYAILTMNLTKISFSEFNATKTINFILSRFNEGGYVEINRDIPDPYTTAMSLIAIKYLENQANKSLLIKEIDYSASINYLITKFDKDLGFYDDSLNIPAPVQNYWVLKALYSINSESISEIKLDLINVFLSYRYSGHKEDLIGGFGHEENYPTVFQTGLSIEALRIIGYQNETLYNYSISFINSSQIDTGEVRDNPSSLIGDVFQAAGSILAFYATGRLAKIIHVNHNIIPSEQVPIDYDNMQIKLRLEIEENDLDYLNISYLVQEKNIRGLMYFDGVSYYILNMLPKMLGFGNFTVRFEMYPRDIIFTLAISTYEISFRVGYKLVTEFNATQLKPAETLSMKVNVTFGKNDTIVLQGELIINITDNAGALVRSKIFTLNGSQIIYTWPIPADYILGRYHILVYVNDTHGYNHTISITDVIIVDDLNITFTKELSDAYYIGEIINTSIIIRYNYSKALVPTVPSVHLSIRNESYYLLEEEVNWTEKGLINITTEIPSVIPDKNNLTIYIRFNWPDEIEQTYLIKNITILTGHLIVDKLENLKKNYFYGDNISFSLGLLVEETNTSIQNATIIADIVNDTESVLQTIYASYDNVTLLYDINEKINPNIPQGTYSLVLRVYIPYNKSYMDLTTDNELEININGTLVGKIVKIKGTLLEGEITEIIFNVSCKENRKLINGLLLASNATSKKFNTSSIATEIDHGIYSIGFKILKASKYNVEVFRVSDKQVILSFEITIKKKETEAAAFFELYGPAISVGIITLLILAYVFIYWWFGSKISKRYLIRKLRRK